MKVEAQVFLSRAEMEALANGITGFYNLAAKEKMTPSTEQTALILSAMEKFKKAATLLDSGIHT